MDTEARFGLHTFSAKSDAKWCKNHKPDSASSRDPPELGGLLACFGIVQVFVLNVALLSNKKTWFSPTVGIQVPGFRVSGVGWWVQGFGDF